MTSSAFRYAPDDTALITAPWNITLLSQRDVDVRIPINFDTVPGISVTAACFANNIYEDYATVKCISNLLATGFRRLSFDLYWDAGRSVWTFCPVSLPSSSEAGSGHTVLAGTSKASSTSARTTSTTAFSTATADSQPRNIGERQFELNSLSKLIAQERSTTTSGIGKATLTISLTTVDGQQAAILPTEVPTGSTEVLFSVGPYTCSSTRATDILTALLPSFLEDTDNTIDAVTQFVILNVHATASFATPLAPAQAPEAYELPNTDNLLGQFLTNNASSFLFTPSILEQDRMDLNESWLSTNSEKAGYSPSSDYFNVSNVDGVLVSDNGWSSPSYDEFRANSHRRLIVGYGEIDPQMNGYNFTGDDDVIFPQNFTTNFVDVDTSINGTIVSGCIYNPNTTSLASANSSWAIYADSQSVNVQLASAVSQQYTSGLPALSNLTFCAISPFLNISLSNATADTDILPYKYYAYSSIWSWAWEEPLVNRTDLRCAMMDPEIPGGRWRAAECSTPRYGACQGTNAPLLWEITTQQGGYDNVGSFCPSNTTFASPRTSIENRYLYEAYMANPHLSNKSEPLWINLNSKDVPSCWIAGVNATCPYNVEEDDVARIYVPTVAGVVILILTALLILIKCGANRAHSKRKRKGENGWDYEGVPS